MMGMKGTNIFESVVESVLVFPCPLLWCLSFLTFGSSVCVCVCTLAMNPLLIMAFPLPTRLAIE